MEYQFIGKDIPFAQSLSRAAGSTLYAGDFHLPGMLYLKLVYSGIPHGMLTDIDTGAAEASPGVAAVFTYRNTPDTLYDRGAVRLSESAPAQEQMFPRHIRFAGERIAAVAADTMEHAEEAAALVVPVIEPLKPFLSPEETLASSEASNRDVPIHEKDSVVSLPQLGFGDYDAAKGTEITHGISMQRVSHIPMEPHCVVADYNRNSGRMTIWTPTQGVFGVRTAVSVLTGLPLAHIRVVKATMGGSFGCKQEFILEPLAAYASYTLGKPVMLRFSRSESMVSTVCKHPIQSVVTGKFDQDGRITGMRIDNILDAGAYQTISPGYGFAFFTKFCRGYRINNAKYNARTVCTNAPVSGGYRGWGGPEAALARESLLNAAARQLQMDPVELRLKNIAEPGSFCEVNGWCVEDLRIRDVLVKGRDRFGWDERCAVRQTGRYRRGKGMACAAYTSGYAPTRNDWGTVIVKMEEDGSVSVNCCVHDHGCGSVAAMQKMTAEILSIDPALVAVPEADTSVNPLDNGCYSSRTVFVLGNALCAAARGLLEKVIEYAAQMLGCLPEDLTVKDGSVALPGGKTLTYRDIACSYADTAGGALISMESWHADRNPAPSCAHFAEVEVDTWTGLCRVVHSLQVQDVGRAINPASCRSQIGSALQQGIGIVFCEDMGFDPVTGITRNSSLQRYHVARFGDMPSLDILLIEEPEACGPFGAKSIGEASYLPVAPALLAAVNDALGTDFCALPLTPERILAATADED